MDILFLDQNKWIDLARIVAGKDQSAIRIRLLDQLVLAVEQRRLLVPLTISHIIETSKRNDLKSRKSVAEIQARLSRGYVFRSRKGRLLVEMRNALHLLFGERPVVLPTNWAVVPGFMQAFDTYDALVATPSQSATSRLINQRVDPAAQYIDYMLTQDDGRRRTAVTAFSAESDALLSRIEGRRRIMIGASMDLRYRAYAAKLFLDHQGFVAHMLSVIGRTVDDMKALGDRAVIDFFRHVPTLDVEAEIAVRLEVQEGDLESNDIRDVLSFYTAVPYAGRLVAERKFSSLARQANLPSKYRFALHTQLEELENVYL